MVTTKNRGWNNQPQGASPMALVYMSGNALAAGESLFYMSGNALAAGESGNGPAKPTPAASAVPLTNLKQAVPIGR